MQFEPEGLTTNPRPILGFRYGRWKIGTNSDPEPRIGTQIQSVREWPAHPTAALGLGYRLAVNPQWAWCGSLSASRPLGQLAQIGSVSWGWAGWAAVLGKF